MLGTQLNLASPGPRDCGADAKRWGGTTYNSFCKMATRLVRHSAESLIAYELRVLPVQDGNREMS